MAFQKRDEVHNMSQVGMFLNYSVLSGFPRKCSLRQSLSTSFLVGTINQGARVKGKAHHKQMAGQYQVCPGSVCW